MAVRTPAFEWCLAAAACVAVGSWYSLGNGLTVGVAIAVLLSPLWVKSLWSSQGGPLILSFGVLAMISGYWLTVALSTSHRVSPQLQAQNLFFVAALVGGIGVLVWARSVMGSGWMALFFGVGLFVGVAFRGIETDNAWKFSLSVPTVVVLLAIAMLLKSRLFSLLMIVALAFISAVNDSRSSTSILLVAAGMLAWEYVMPRNRDHSSSWRTAGAFALIAFAAYNALQTFILEGWLGSAAQQRTEAQIELSGSLIVGGRPEMGATAALLNANPLGFGAGIVPSFHDIVVAKTGMQSLNYEPNNGYVENYMFGSGFEVHSLVGDFWLRFGLPGLALILTLIAIAVWGAVRAVTKRRASGLQLVLAVQVAWDGLFAPLYSVSLSTLMLAVALAVTTRPGRRDGGESLSGADSDVVDGDPSRRQSRRA